jgi:hypothetical protein
MNKDLSRAVWTNKNKWDWLSFDVKFRQKVPVPLGLKGTVSFLNGRKQTVPSTADNFKKTTQL